ncbi:hypothetical protein [Amnibacterium kyonggiense]
MSGVIFGLVAAIVLVAFGGAIAAAVVPARLVRRCVLISTSAFLAMTAALVVTWTRLPHDD